MPAAELTRLRQQINSLIAQFGDPPRLQSGLRDLFELYSNRAYRAGHAVQPQPLLPSHRVPPLIMHQLELELSKTCQEMPDQALAVVDALWHDPYLEPHLLAAALLGAIPASHAAGVVEKLRAWVLPSENFRMLDALFHQGTVTLRRSAPGQFLDLCETWISDKRMDMQALGLRAMAPLINDPAFENIPAVFRLLSPILQSAPNALHTDLQIVLEALAKRTPTETTYFLRQVLGISTGPGTARLVRRCLPLFAPAQQASLRAALQASSSS